MSPSRLFDSFHFYSLLAQEQSPCCAQVGENEVCNGQRAGLSASRDGFQLSKREQVEPMRMVSWRFACEDQGLSQCAQRKTKKAQ